MDAERWQQIDEADQRAAARTVDNRPIRRVVRAEPRRRMPSSRLSALVRTSLDTDSAHLGRVDGISLAGALRPLLLSQ